MHTTARPHSIVFLMDDSFGLASSPGGMYDAEIGRSRSARRSCFGKRLAGSDHAKPGLQTRTFEDQIEVGPFIGGPNHVENTLTSPQQAASWHCTAEARCRTFHR